MYKSTLLTNVENPRDEWLKKYGNLDGCCGCDCHCSTCGGACPPCSTEQDKDVKLLNKKNQENSIQSLRGYLKQRVF
jgi:hypothetical protein